MIFHKGETIEQHHPKFWEDVQSAATEITTKGKGWEREEGYKGGIQGDRTSTRGDTRGRTREDTKGKISFSKMGRVRGSNTPTISTPNTPSTPRTHRTPSQHQHRPTKYVDQGGRARQRPTHKLHLSSGDGAQHSRQQRQQQQQQLQHQQMFVSQMQHRRGDRRGQYSGSRARPQ